MTRYRGQWALTVLAIAIGVAAVVAVDLANQSALRAFDTAHRVLTGAATHRLVGGPEGVPEAVYRWLRLQQGLQHTAPVVEGRGRLPALDRTIKLLGLDVFAEDDVRADMAGSIAADGNSGRLMADPGSALVPDSLLQQLGILPGGTFTLRIGGQDHVLTAVGRLAGDETVLADLIVVDIATAQELLDRLGTLSWIDLVLDPAAAGSLQASLPPGLRLIAASEQAGALSELTAAFRLNLTALSLLALLVGMFLIYNTLSFAVVRRRQMVGTMRAIGVTQREAMSGLLLEALLLGGIGTVCGLLLGMPLAQGLVRLVGQTVDALYAEQAALALVLTPFSLGKAVLLGVLGTLLAAWLPAQALARLPPRTMLSRAALEAGSHRWLVRAAAIGLALLLAGVLVLFGGRGLVAGFAGLFMIVLGAALWVPVVSGGVMALAAWPLGALLGVSGRLAGRGAVASLSRTGTAVTALAVAVAAVVGVGIMIHSFRLSVSAWLEHTLRADVYLSVESGGGSPFTPAVLARIERLPEVAEVSLSRRLQVTTENGSVQLSARDLHARGWSGFSFLAGTPAQAHAGFVEGGIIVSEPFAYRHRLAVGDTFSLPTKAGPHAFPVVGIYRDYGSDRGVVTLHADTFKRWFGDSPVGGVGVYAAAGVSPARLMTALQPLVADLASVRMQSQHDLKRRSLEIFDQTFVITNVLRLLAAMVAFAGILAALMALQLDRAREMAVLRTIGFTPVQSAGLTVTQSGLLGLLAGLCALPIGILLSDLLIRVILRRAFGWTMDFQVPAGVLAEGVLLALCAALVAALYPAWQSYKTPPATALREEA
jgi:putative ABC transport system permease protein